MIQELVKIIKHSYGENVRVLVLRAPAGVLSISYVPETEPGSGSLVVTVPGEAFAFM